MAFPEVNLGALSRPFPHLLQHRVLLEDGTRMGALAAAIRAVVRPGDVVLEVGTGTGVLAVLAARAGARRVYAVERTGVAEVARAVARENGVAARVRVLEGEARSVRLPERADVLITETIGHLGLEEGLAGIVRDARRRHLKPEARVLPRRLRLLVAPVSLPAFAQAGRRAYKIRWPADGCLAPPVAVWDVLLDGSQGPPSRLAGTVAFQGLREGRLSGFAAYFEAELAPGLTLSSRAGTTWRPVFFPLPTPIRVGRTTAVHLRLGFAERRAGCRVAWAGVVRTGPRLRPFSAAAGPTG